MSTRMFPFYHVTTCLVWWLARLIAIQEVPGSIPGYTLEIFLKVWGSGTESTQPREDNWVAT